MTPAVRDILSEFMYYSGMTTLLGKCLRKGISTLRILVYHKIVNDAFLERGQSGFPGIISVGEFEKQLIHIKKKHSIISINDLLNGLERWEIPENSILITFDDGYRELYDYALPVLSKYNVAATIFYTGGTIEGEAIWCDSFLSVIINSKIRDSEMGHRVGGYEGISNRMALYKQIIIDLRKERASVRRDKIQMISERLGVREGGDCKRYLDKSQIKEMKKWNITFGAHSMSHGLLGALKDKSELEWEIRRSVELVEEITGESCYSFAYPFGDEEAFSNDCVEILKKSGIRLAFTTLRGGNRAGCDPFRMRRFIVREYPCSLLKLQLSGVLDG